MFTIHFPLQCTIIIKVNQYWLHKTNPPFVDFYTLIETRLIWATVLKRRSKIHRERKLYFYRLLEFCERRIGEALQKTVSSLKHSESHKIKNETNLKFYFSFRFCHIFFSTLPKNLAFLHCECYRMRLRYFAPVLAMATMETKWKLGRTIFTLKSAGAEKQIHSVWKTVKLTDNDKQNRVQDRTKNVKSFVKPWLYYEKAGRWRIYGRQPRRQGRSLFFIEGLNGVLPWTFDG